MRISFEQSGGIAGLSKKINLDTNFLPSSEVQEVQSLIDTSNFYDLPNNTGQPNPDAADYLRYKITLESDNGRKHTVETTDVTTPAGLSPFIGYLRRKIQEQRR